MPDFVPLWRASSFLPKMVHSVVSQLQQNKKLWNHYFSAGIRFLLQNNKTILASAWWNKKHQLGTLVFLVEKTVSFEAGKIVFLGCSWFLTVVVDWLLFICCFCCYYCCCYCCCCLLLFVVFCLLFFVCCFCLLLVVCCFLFVAFCLLFCLLFVVVVLLSCCLVVLLFCCFVVLLFCCFVVLLVCCCCSCFCFVQTIVLVLF